MARQTHSTGITSDRHYQVAIYSSVLYLVCFGTVRSFPLCSSTLACDDPGQICSQGRCVCITDMGPDTLEFWTCDNVMDCEGPIRFASDELSYAGHGPATDTLNMEAPSCTTSTVCPNPDRRFGYCDIFWPDGDALVSDQ